MNIDPLSFFIEMFQQQGISHFFIDQDILIFIIQSKFP